jgi:hypothetical protein
MAADTACAWTDRVLTNIDTSGHSNGFSIRVTHTGRQMISSGTTQHFVGAQDMVRVGTDLNVVGIVSNGLGKILVDGRL